MRIGKIHYMNIITVSYTHLTLATKKVENGKDIKLTIDADLQQSLYKEYQNDKSASVAMNPKTGEILALVSTPSFSSNDFIFGFSSAEWQALNDEDVYKRQ